MENLLQINEQLQEQIEGAIKQFTWQFNQLNQILSSVKNAREVKKGLQHLYTELLQFHQRLSGDIRQLGKNIAKQLEQIKEFEDENYRLNELLAALIGFSGQVRGKKALMQEILDTLARTLSTDSSYVLLTDETGNITLTLGQNMDADRERDVQDWSRTVIRETIQGIEPQKVDRNQSVTLPKSFQELDIKSAMCVPICIDKRCLGVVYVDRRESEKPFTSSELAFLIKFSNLIASSLQVSIHLENLQSRLLDKLILSRAELDEVFICQAMVGHSRALLDVLRVAAQVAPTDVGVLITGESGTGKELLARAIHENSMRREHPFVAINCGAIPENLLESELFGYKAGAFTGARHPKPGKLALADHGTIFLDEVGELHPSLQAKLLRVLQFGELEPLGSTSPKHIDVRIIAATNQNLQGMISRGEFREDLYYRLRVIELHLPALRERREDIPELIEYFLNKHSPPDRHIRISQSAINVLESYNWPGNVRELENIIQRALVLCQENVITVKDLPPEIQTLEGEILGNGEEKTLAEAETEFRRLYIRRVLRSSKSKAEAARRLGVNRSYLYKLIEELGLLE